LSAPPINNSSFMQKPIKITWLQAVQIARPYNKQNPPIKLLTFHSNGLLTLFICFSATPT
ncbi:hypothetical protein, partial [Agrobacterium pusense]|uniref:hypothetical protein n=1 Tax=Agrobacterium pusense TaxID=648995 RepID=UPI0024150290